MSPRMSHQSHCRHRNEAAISAVVRVGMWSARGQLAGVCLFFGEVPGCRVMHE
jgi:hypothetical protein